MFKKIKLSGNEVLALKDNPVLLQQHLALIKCFNSLTEFLPEIGGILMMKKFQLMDTMDVVEKAFNLDANEIQELLTNEINYKTVVDPEDLMTMEDFIGMLECHCILDSDDGHGYYAFADKISDKRIDFDIAILDKSFTHVAWYNK